MHSLGPRAAGPFVAVTCASLDDATAAAKSARHQSSGGKAEPGFYEQARGGTLFLGGVEDLSAHAQRMLLADLEQRGWQRDGVGEVMPFDSRFVTAAAARDTTDRRAAFGATCSRTSRSSRSASRRSANTPRTCRNCCATTWTGWWTRKGMPFRRFSVAAQNRLRNYPWPGNVRELRNLVQRVLIIGGPEEIGLDEIEQHLVAQQAPDEPLVKQDLLALPLREAREQFERAYLLQQLMLCNGKVGLLAKRVGMERTHLYRKLRSLGVDFRQITED